MRETVKLTVTRVRGPARERVEDLVAGEVRLRILADGRPLASLFCTPSMIRELVTGFVLTEGLLPAGFCAERMSIVYGEEITVDLPAEPGLPETGEGTITSGCAGGVTYARHGGLSPASSGPETPFERLSDLFRGFQSESVLYKTTGGAHSAALAGLDGIIVRAEDIGRHNAVDKVLGYTALEGIGLEDKLLLTSGRLSSEIALKCARWRIPVLVSRSAPTSKAVETAERYNITLVGFLRGNGCNIYTHPERITG